MSEPQDSDPLTDSKSTPPTNVRWLVLALACGTSFFLYLHRYTWNFIAPELQNTYHWTPSEIQNAYTCFNWTYGFGQIPSGVLINRLGPRGFLAAIVALWSLVIPLQAGGSRLLVPLSRLGLGATQAGCYPGLAQVTARWFPLRYRTIVQS
ncbi:MAG: MFS transporter, partial [Planctomycetota bacterium]|nr:MFS transporter [Planctomycetota bacterium]